ncbi:lysylphosphatidylglycerol synthase domain-containing protein [Methylocapsa sp. S129]|uniref:lysylphosphatidylglycerol synthase domain-containing protein n=1 Tax=Methylocapsa sp. S129 TaxID=1641869 RepID=UPI00131ACDB5|nr:lysylphosphatidylglycerol synthase domain-containing protein [Methylocapsa sp. S129]
MSKVAILALVAGLIGAVALVVGFGAGAIAAAIVDLGWLGFLLLCIAHAPVAGLLGMGWRVCLKPVATASSLGLIWARVLRDAGAEVLPFSEIGGMIIGVRAAILAGVSGAEAAASTLVDLTTEFVAQLAFIALGLLALEEIRPGAAIIRPALFGIVACLAFTGLLAFSLRRSPWLSRLVRAGAKRWLSAFGEVDNALTALSEVTARPGALAASFALHLLAWLGVAFEAWLALRLIGAPISIEGAVAMESLLFASRSLAFFIPNALGVQEGAYALLAPLVGLTPADALALSLIKRARDLAIGAPALLIWQRAEAARAWSKRSGPAH